MHGQVGVPRVHVAHRATVVGLVARGRQHDAVGMHELAPREVPDEHARQEQVHVEYGADAGYHHRMQRHQPHGHFLDALDVNAEEVAHRDAGYDHAQQQEQREEVVRQRQVAHARDHDAPDEQERERAHDQKVGEVERRQPDLEERVGAFEGHDGPRHRLQEEAQVAQHDDQHGPVEHERAEPQPLRRAHAEGLALLLGLRVAEQRPEHQHLEQHAAHDAREGRGVLYLVLLDPRQRLLLAAGGGDTERHGRLTPLHEAEHEPAHKARQGEIGNDDAEHGVEARVLRAHPGHGGEGQRQDQGADDPHTASPSRRARSRASLLFMRPSPLCISSNLIWFSFSRDSTYRSDA